MKAENGADTEEIGKTATPTVERLGLVDYAVSILLGIVAIVLISVWAFPGIYPAVWDNLAIAAGLRPAENIAPGIWHLAASKLFSALGFGGAVSSLKIAGAVVSGISAGLAYLLFREVLSLSSRQRLQHSELRSLIVRLASALGALFFVCSDPVWRAGQFFSPDSFLLLLTLLGLYLFFSFLQSGWLVSAYVSMFVLGVLSAETPIGFVFVAFCWGVYFLAIRRVLVFDMPLLNPFVEQISKWHMTFLFAFGLLAGIALDCYGFCRLDGLEANAMAASDLPVAYGVRMWNMAITAATPLGWLLALGIVLLPCGVSAGLLPRAVDEEQFLPYHVGILFFATSLLAYAQMSSVDALWMWTWISHPPTFKSSYLLCVLLLAASATAVFGMVVLGVDAFCRNHRRLAMQMFAEMRTDEEGEQMLASKRFLGIVRRVGLVLLPIFLIAGVVPGRRLVPARRMAAVLRDYVEEVCRECGDAKWLFTDGSFDSAFELEAKRNGRDLRALSLMSGNSPRAVWIRSCNVADQEDVLTMKSGAAATLRTWIRDKPERLAETAMQLGFEVWKRDGKTPPPCSGLLCKPSGSDEAERVRGIDAARCLAERILAMYANGEVDSSAGRQIDELFLFVQWRLTRMMRIRAEQADMAGRPEDAIGNIKLADELDKHNSAIKNIRESMERMRQMMMRQMTPREGLQLALVRADFALARKYATPILDAVPEDPNANFGMGMSYFVEGQWARSEEYLRRCILKNPNEPAVYNNIAIIQLKTGRYEAALGSVKKALELAPDSAEVKDTMKQVETAIAIAERKRQAAKGGKGDSK